MLLILLTNDTLNVTKKKRTGQLYQPPIHTSNSGSTKRFSDIEYGTMHVINNIKFKQIRIPPTAIQG